MSDDSSLHNWKKVIRCNTVQISDDQYEFLLPGHKADRFYEGNRIIIAAERYQQQPLLFFRRYLESRDHLHPIASALWLTEEGLVPTRSFFINRLRQFFDQRPIYEGWRGNRTCWTWRSSPYHTGMRPMVIRRLLHIHQKKSHLVTGLFVRSSPCHSINNNTTSSLINFLTTSSNHFISNSTKKKKKKLF